MRSSTPFACPVSLPNRVPQPNKREAGSAAYLPTVKQANPQLAFKTENQT